MNDLIQRLEQALVGKRVTIARRETGNWSGNVEGGGVISLCVPWRIIAEGRIAFADQDDGQQFGLPETLDGQSEANRLLSSRTVIGLSVDEETGDLTLRFAGDVRLEAFNNSSGYEGWQIDGLAGMHVIALGGGETAAYL